MSTNEVQVVERWWDTVGLEHFKDDPIVEEGAGNFYHAVVVDGEWVAAVDGPYPSWVAALRELAAHCIEIGHVLPNVGTN